MGLCACGAYVKDFRQAPSPHRFREKSLECHFYIAIIEAPRVLFSHRFYSHRSHRAPLFVFLISERQIRACWKPLPD